MRTQRNSETSDERIDTSECSQNRRTNPPPVTPPNHLYFTTTYTKLSPFVIDRSSVQVPSSAPVNFFCFHQLPSVTGGLRFSLWGLSSPPITRSSYPESCSIQDVDRSALSSSSLMSHRICHSKNVSESLLLYMLKTRGALRKAVRDS